MKKIAITLSVATLLLGGLVGCGNDNQGARGLGNADQRGFGYHTTDDRNDTRLRDNRIGEGPITDMFTRDDRRDNRGLNNNMGTDSTGFGTRTGLNSTNRNKGLNRGTSGFGATRETKIGRHTNQGMGENWTDFGRRTNRGLGRANGTGYRGAYDTNFKANNHGMTGFGAAERGDGIVGDRDGYVDNRGILKGRGTTDQNRIGGLGQRNRNAYPNGYDVQSVGNITDRVENIKNVRDCRVVANDDKVIVAAEVDGQNRQKIEQEIRRAIQSMVGNKEVVVVTDNDQFNQVRTMDDNLRNGGAIEEFGAMFNNMFRDFGRGIQRPFQNR